MMIILFNYDDVDDSDDEDDDNDQYYKIGKIYMKARPIKLN